MKFWEAIKIAMETGCDIRNTNNPSRGPYFYRKQGDKTMAGVIIFLFCVAYFLIIAGGIISFTCKEKKQRKFTYIKGGKKDD